MKKYFCKIVLLCFFIPITLYASTLHNDISDSINKNKMTYFYGIMCSGKSRTLLETYEKLISDPSNVVIAFAPKRDTSSLEGEIKSRDIETSLSAFPISENICNIIKETAEQNSTKHIFIFFDEAQFIPENVLDTIWKLINPIKNINACFFGLRVDVFDNLFPGSKWFEEHKSEPCIEILPIKSRAKCPCGKEAEYSVRFNSDGEIALEGAQVVLEGEATYGVRCLDHKAQGLNWEKALLEAKKI